MYHFYGQTIKIYKIILLICYQFSNLLLLKKIKEIHKKIHKLLKLFKLLMKIVKPS
jgi:hypothetical protein